MPPVLPAPLPERFEALLSVLPLLQMVGVVAYAVAGSVEAKRRGLDVVGAISIAFVTAFGGGSLRDLLLGRTPVFWLRHPLDTAVVFAAALIAFYSVRASPREAAEDDTDAGTRTAPRRRGVVRKIVLIADALGLGIFGAVGAAYAVESSAPMLAAALMGVTTGVFGGVLRDVMLNEIPTIFRRNSDLYATCVFVGVWPFLLLHAAGLPDGIALLAGAGTITGLRLMALRYRWRLPIPAR